MSLFSLNANTTSVVALMGASGAGTGAGKTTLLNTLPQRQKIGVVSGDMLVDGRALGTEFQRGTGFCEQMNLRDGTATIREAIEFRLFSDKIEKSRELGRSRMWTSR